MRDEPDSTPAAVPTGAPAPAPAAATVGDVGEAGLLARILPRAQRRPGTATLVPTGDDAAVVAATDGRYVVTTDLMVQGPDFRLEWHHPRDLGRKACASNLADVAAMGAAPTAVVIALAVPDTTPIAWLDAFGAGFDEHLNALAPDAGIVGGDLSTSNTIVVSVTAFGDLGGRAPVLRSGARPGDVLALAGHAGRSASGLAAFLHAEGLEASGSVPDALARLREASAAEAEVADTPASRALHGALRAHLAPRPPVAAGVAAADAGATAMMDVSDGLLLDATRLARASDVGLELESAAFADDVALLAALEGPHGAPIGAAAALERCLTGGEEHALLAAFPPGAALPHPFRRVGRVTGAPEAGAERVRVDGVPRAPVGWDPYAHPRTNP